MTRAGLILLSLGTALFIALLAWQGVGAVASTFLAAGWGSRSSRRSTSCRSRSTRSRSP